MQQASITARKTCRAQKHQDVGEKTMKEEHVDLRVRPVFDSHTQVIVLGRALS